MSPSTEVNARYRKERIQQRTMKTGHAMKTTSACVAEATPARQRRSHAHVQERHMRQVLQAKDAPLMVTSKGAMKSMSATSHNASHTSRPARLARDRESYVHLPGAML